MIRAELKQQAKDQLKGNLWMLVLASLIISAVGMVGGMIPIVGGIAVMVVSPALSLGLVMMYLNVTYGEGANISTLFDGFKYLLPAFVLNLLIGIFTFLWSLLLIVPGIIKGISYSMSFYILAENPEMTAKEAINESKEIMEGHKMEFFVLQLSFIPWFLLVAVTFGIAAIYVVPYVGLTLTNFYHNVKKQKSTMTVNEVEA